MSQTISFLRSTTGWAEQERLCDAPVCGADYGPRGFAQSGSSHGHPSAKNVSLVAV